MKNYQFSASRQKGFTLLELSIALLIIALLIGALSVGSDLQRNANYQRLATSFVRGWQLSFLTFTEKVGVVPVTVRPPNGQGQRCQ